MTTHELAKYLLQHVQDFPIFIGPVKNEQPQTPRGKIVRSVSGENIPVGKLVCLDQVQILKPVSETKA